MVKVERGKEEIVIRVPATFDEEDIEKVLDYLKYRDLNKGSKVSQHQVDSLADEIKSGWWERNKDRFPSLK